MRRPQSPSLWASCARGPEHRTAEVNHEKAPSSLFLLPYLSLCFSATLRRSTGGRVSSRKCSHAAWFRTHDDEQRRRRRRQRRHRRRARRQKEGREARRQQTRFNGRGSGGRQGRRRGRRRQHLPFSPSSQRRRSLRGLHLCEAYGIIPASGRAKGASTLGALLITEMGCVVCVVDGDNSLH